MSNAISLDLLKAKEQWHSQTQYADSRKLGQLTGLLEYMTVLLEHLNLQYKWQSTAQMWRAQAHHWLHH